MTLAPIVLFVYNRPWHTKQTVEALQKNVLAKDSELTIYSDGPKSGKSPKIEQSIKDIVTVRDYLKTIDGFKKITIIEQESNQGLAKSIITGVTSTINEHGRVIVLEDDLVTSPYFLTFMNEALAFYEKEDRVWHISGWNYPISGDGIGDVYLWRLMTCCGWATWADRWQYFEKDTEKLISTFTREDISYINLEGSFDGWWQVMANKRGKIDTWAVYWLTTIAKHRKLCLNPAKSFLKNIGFDGSGVHSGNENDFNTDVLNNSKSLVMETDFKENAVAVARIKEFYDSIEISFYMKCKRWVARLLGYC